MKAAVARRIVQFIAAGVMLAAVVPLGLGEDSAGQATSAPSGTDLADQTPLSQRILHKEVVVPATRAQLWRAWTTREGMAEWWVKHSLIELRVLGRFELHIKPDAPEGQRGAEGCRVLSYLPQEMFSFEWNFPPKVPSLRDSGAKTHVVLHFDDLGNGQVRVRLDQLGWQDGADWQAGYAYFDNAWAYVLNLLKDHFTNAATPTNS